jgi:hypothetical protein
VLSFQFEHWIEDKLIEVLSIEANSVSEGVSFLSDKHKGVFRLC